MNHSFTLSCSIVVNVKARWKESSGCCRTHSEICKQIESSDKDLEIVLCFSRKCFILATQKKKTLGKACSKEYFHHHISVRIVV